jgi:hypothetical protein
MSLDGSRQPEAAGSRGATRVENGARPTAAPCGERHFVRSGAGPYRKWIEDRRSRAFQAENRRPGSMEASVQRTHSHNGFNILFIATFFATFATVLIRFS